MVATFEMFSPDPAAPTGEQPEIEHVEMLAVDRSFEIDPILFDPVQDPGGGV